MAFNGKWKLTSCEGMVEFTQSIGIKGAKTPEGADFVNPAKDVVEEFQQTADRIRTIITIGGKQWKDESVAIGKEDKVPGLDGRPATHLVTINGNSLTRKQKGEGYECTYLRTVDGNNMTLVMTGPGGTQATRKYVKQ